MIADPALFYLLVPLAVIPILFFIYRMCKRKKSFVNPGYPHPPAVPGPLPFQPGPNDQAPPYNYALQMNTSSIFAITEPNMTPYLQMRCANDDCYPPNFVVSPFEPPPPYPGLEKTPKDPSIV
ncbi:unnamed protein product [Caenorhabditis auriculariae]|uniref:Uncharacterized protein n=1 Tax=Caenorhabditis auriculariae TaxID=2777116 RepID=A0A8S1H951_9PELO|nr:unnamed protein product [Caenorhabditis auriculariae]